MSNSTAALSIIVPVYNAEKYLNQCIDSLLRAIDKDEEIILVNDGSQDRSKEICSYYAANYKNIIFVDKKNKGSSNTRNHGMKIANGEYITFIDSDDFVLSELYKEFIEKIKLLKSDVVCIGMQELNKGYINKKKFIDKGLRNNFINNPVYMHSVCNKAFKRHLLLENNILFDEDLTVCEDLLFVFKAMTLANTISYLDIYPYVYRRGVDSVTSNTDIEKKCSDEIESSRRMENFGIIQKLEEDYSKVYEFRFMNAAIRYIANIEVFNPSKYRKLNVNNYIWNYTIKPSYFFLTIFGNLHMDIFPYLYISAKKTILQLHRG